MKGHLADIQSIKMKTPILLSSVATLLFFTGHRTLGASAVIGCLALGYIMDENESKQRNSLDDDDALYEMKSCEKQPLTSDNLNDTRRQIVLTKLDELSRKYQEEKEDVYDENSENLALLCQEAAYMGLRSFPTDVHVMARSMSVLALVAKDSDVRQRHLNDADHFGIDLPIWCLRQALSRARYDIKYATELQDTELPYKAGNMLAALSDGDSDMAQLIIKEEGLETMFEAAKWYREYSEVAQMSLMALFHLRSGDGDDGGNKIASDDMDAISIVIQLMRHCPDNVQVARYGMSILFDILDGGDQSPPDLMEIRSEAVNEGLHEVVANAMDKLPYDEKIKTIGQDILACTENSVHGALPEYGYRLMSE